MATATFTTLKSARHAGENDAGENRATDPLPAARRPATAAIAAAAPIRCLVVDDHAAVRAGLRDLLGDDPRFVVLDTVASAESAVAFVQRTRVDVAIVDYRLPGRTGLWCSRKLKRLAHPPSVLVYSAYSDDALAAGCVVAEADGLLGKSRVDVELRDAIGDVAAGISRLPALSPALTASLRQRLDAREQAIFGLLHRGATRGEIVEILSLADAELQTTLRTMLDKLELAGVID